MAQPKTNIGGEKFWPLSVDQFDAFHTAAVNAAEPLEELVGLALLHTGMRSAEFHHMRASWLERDPAGELRIVIPKEEVCTGGSGEAGPDNRAGINLHDRGVPCHRCRNDTPEWVASWKGAEEGYHNDHWYPKSRSSGGRVIPIESLDDKRDALEIFEWWFDGNEEVPLLHKSVNDKIEKITERAGIERKVTAHDLRTTFATNLARNGVDRVYTRDLMGHKTTDATDPYYKFIGADLKSELEDKL